MEGRLAEPRHEDAGRMAHKCAELVTSGQAMAGNGPRQPLHRHSLSQEEYFPNQSELKDPKLWVHRVNTAGTRPSLAGLPFSVKLNADPCRATSVSTE